MSSGFCSDYINLVKLNNLLQQKNKNNILVTQQATIPSNYLSHKKMQVINCTVQPYSQPIFNMASTGTAVKNLACVLVLPLKPAAKTALGHGPVVVRAGTLITTAPF